MKGLSPQQTEILKEIAVIGGLVAVAVLAPNAIRLFGGYGKPKSRSEYSLKRSLDSLTIRGLIRHEKGKIVLTSQGKNIARVAIYRQQFVVNRKSWDKNWRLIMFDIPEKLKQERGHFRQLLIEFDFVQIQKSVYVSPYDCLPVIREIVINTGLVRYVSFVETDNIETSRNLIRLFNLNH